MTSTLIQFRVEEAEKRVAIQICKKLGITLNTYLRICLIRLIEERGIPFSMKRQKENNPGILAMERARKIAKETSISAMTLKEINAEIAEARKAHP